MTPDRDPPIYTLRLPTEFAPTPPRTKGVLLPDVVKLLVGHLLEKGLDCLDWSSILSGAFSGDPWPRDCSLFSPPLWNLFNQWPLLESF